MAIGDPISDLSDFVNLVTGGNSGNPETRMGYKDSRNTAGAAVATVSGRLTSLWTHIGQPTHGAVPAAAAVPTNATAGALGQSTPVGGRTKRLTGVFAASSQTGTFVVYDRLSHQGGLSGTVTTAQTTNLPTAALTRQTNGSGVELWLEIYTAIGATATTVTASYTNQAGTAGQVTIATAFGGVGLQEQDRVIPLPLASGDSGVRAVASVTVLASTLTAGNFGVTLAKPLVTLPMPYQGSGTYFNALYEQGGPFDCNSGGASGDGCLAFLWLANGTTVPQIMPGSMFYFIEK
jgi:hypothetical protein